MPPRRTFLILGLNKRMPYFCLKPSILLFGALAFFSFAKISFALSIDAPFYAEKSNPPRAETANNRSTIKHPLRIQYFLSGHHHLSISGHQHLKPGNIQVNTHVNVSSNVHFPGNLNKLDKERPCDDRTTTGAIPVSTSAPSQMTTTKVPVTALISEATTIAKTTTQTPLPTTTSTQVSTTPSTTTTTPSQMTTKGSTVPIEATTSRTTLVASSSTTTTPDSSSVTVPFTTIKVPVTTVTSEATTIAQTTTQTPMPTTTSTEASTTPSTTTASTLPRPLSPIITPITAPPSGDSTEMGIRRQRVYNLMRTAWTYYEKTEWGKDRIVPLDTQKLVRIPGRHIIASLSSLYVMGFHEQFNKAKQYLETTFQFTPESETLNDDLYGSLLSTYALTGDKLFLRKATEFANKSGTFPVPGASIEHPFYSWANRKLEFQYLSDLTGNASYLEKLGPFENFISSLNEQTKIIQTYGLSMVMDVKTALQTQFQSLGPYYKKVEHLLTNGGIVQKTFGGTKYVYGSNPSIRKNSFGYCAYGAMLALGAKEDPSKSNQLELAKELTDTCFKAASAHATELPYDGFFISDNGKISTGNSKSDFRHIPQLAESYFVLWRLTGDRKYQNYADKLVQRFMKGWWNTKDVYHLLHTGYSPAMLSATLKYIYLTFSPVDYLPLDRWVFDAAGHPLPICGKNDAYPNCTNWNK